MARGTTLGDLVTKLKAEAGHSSAINLTVDKADAFKQTLRHVQEQLYYDYDWPHLRIVASKTMAAGSRFYDVPVDATYGTINFDRIEAVECEYNDSFIEVGRGIGFGEYNQYDPADDERSDPVLRWDVRWTGSKAQIEVWPLPSSATKLWFRGIRDLSALTSNSDTADLDDNMIVLYAAAEILARQKSEDARAKLAAAQSLYARLKGRSKGASPMTVYGGGDDHRTSRTHGTVIRISG